MTLLAALAATLALGAQDPGAAACHRDTLRPCETACLTAHPLTDRLASAARPEAARDAYDGCRAACRVDQFACVAGRAPEPSATTAGLLAARGRARASGDAEAIAAAQRALAENLAERFGEPVADDTDLSPAAVLARAEMDRLGGTLDAVLAGQARIAPGVYAYNLLRSYAGELKDFEQVLPPETLTRLRVHAERKGGTLLTGGALFDPGPPAAYAGPSKPLVVGPPPEAVCTTQTISCETVCEARSRVANPAADPLAGTTLSASDPSLCKQRCRDTGAACRTRAVVDRNR